MGTAETLETVMGLPRTSESVLAKVVEPRDDAAEEARLDASVAFVWVTLVRMVNCIDQLVLRSLRTLLDVLVAVKPRIDPRGTFIVDATYVLRMSVTWSKGASVVIASVTATVTLGEPVGAEVGALVWVGAWVGL